VLFSATGGEDVDLTLHWPCVKSQTTWSEVDSIGISTYRLKANEHYWAVFQRHIFEIAK